MPHTLERIAKVIAARGWCSRREAEALIANGSVKVDGMLVSTPALKVDRNANIEIDGQQVGSIDPHVRIWLFHKPRGVITTHKDPQGRQTVFSILPKALPRVISVGRLDYNTEGLLILTNSGALARGMELPSSQLIRTYLCRAQGTLSKDVIAALRAGCEIEGVRYGSIEVLPARHKGTNAWFNVSLKEGKNREIRKVFSHFGVLVNRLIRIQYGPFHLGNLSVGSVQEVPYNKAKELMLTLNIKE